MASTLCSACDAGKYAKSEGSSKCIFCPDYQTSPSSSSACECKDTFVPTSNPDEPCSCAPGRTLENGVCVPCAAGFYKSLTSLEACTSCNKFAIEGAVQSSQPASSPLSCICSKGDFRVLEPPSAYSTKIGQCKICPEGTLCRDAGVIIEELPLKKGYWRSDFNSSNVVQCYIEEACSQSPSTKTVESTNPIDDQCADGHTGPVCNVCLPGFAKDVLGSCDTCDEEKFSLPLDSAIFLAVFFGFVSTTAYFCLRKNNKQSGGRLEEFRKRTISKTSRQSSTSDSLFVVTNDRDHWLYRARTKAKILLSFSQILTR